MKDRAGVSVYPSQYNVPHRKKRRSFGCLQGQMRVKIYEKMAFRALLRIAWREM